MRILALSITTLVLSFSASAQAADPLAAFVAETSLPQEDIRAGLTEYLLAKVPPHVAPDSQDAWRAQAQQLRTALRDDLYLRGVPQAWRDHEVRVEWTEDIATDKGYRIRKLRYEALPGLWIPALLYEPDSGTGTIPAILNVNGHVGAPGKSIEYEQIRCINLAKRGMLALHPEWFACGELTDSAYSHANLAYLDLVGISGLSVFHYALERGLDVLLDHPRADKQRVAMTGLSGGGWQTTVFSAIDERIGVIVPNAGHSSLTTRIQSLRDMGDLEQVPVDLLTVGDYSHITSLFAPRPSLLIYNAEDNCCFRAEDALPTVYDPVLPLYERFANPDDFQFHINIDPGTHNYELDNRLQFYRFIEERFLPPAQRRAEEIPCEGELLTFEQLEVGLPANNATFQSLATNHLDRIAHPVYDSMADHAAALRAVVRWPNITFEVAERATENIGGHRATALHIGTPHGPIYGLLVEGGTNSPRAAVYVADKPIAESLEEIGAIASEHGHVLAIEPMFLGASKPAGNSSWQLAMALDATGSRTLGVQAAQVAAACRWLQRVKKSGERHIYCDGKVASAAALIAIAVDIDSARSLTITNGIENFDTTMREAWSWTSHQPLFCFGLAPVSNIPELQEILLDFGVQVMRP